MVGTVRRVAMAAPLKYIDIASIEAALREVEEERARTRHKTAALRVKASRLKKLLREAKALQE